MTVSDRTLLDIEVFSMVLDANKVIAEIRWRLSKRTKPYALTGIFESIEARALVSYVPSYTEHEVLANPKSSHKRSGSRASFCRCWLSPLPRMHAHHQNGNITHVLS